MKNNLLYFVGENILEKYFKDKDHDKRTVTAPDGQESCKHFKSHAHFNDKIYLHLFTAHQFAYYLYSISV